MCGRMLVRVVVALWAAGLVPDTGPSLLRVDNDERWERKNRKENGEKMSSPIGFFGREKVNRR